MPVVDHQTCANANKNLATVDQESMVCAGYATAGNVISGCQGDSGGPFVCEENGRFVLRGAVSWGTLTAKQRKPTLCSLVLVLMWIGSRTKWQLEVKGEFTYFLC